MLLGSPPDMVHRPQSHRACRSLNCTQWLLAILDYYSTRW